VCVCVCSSHKTFTYTRSCTRTACVPVRCSLAAEKERFGEGGQGETEGGRSEGGTGEREIARAREPTSDHETQRLSETRIESGVWRVEGKGTAA